MAILLRLVSLAVAMASVSEGAFADDRGAPRRGTSPTVSTYPASFFADQHPNTALDMVSRLPGFVFDDGASVRGFSGSGGNVLIDGQRPASKTDDLQSILTRLAASDVDHIDLIRGAAPGIDMQGKNVIANVIRKRRAGLRGDVVLGDSALEDGRKLPLLRLEGVGSINSARLEGAVLVQKVSDGSQGVGSRVIYGPDGGALDRSRLDSRGGGWLATSTGSYEAPLYGGAFRVNIMLQDQTYALDASDQFAVAGSQVQHDRQDKSDAELGLHFNRDLSQGVSLEALGLQHVYKTGYSSAFNTTSDAEVFGLTDVGSETIGRAVVHWRPSDKLTVDGGGEFAYNWLKTRTTFSDNGVAEGIPAGNVLVNERRGELSTTATWRPTPELIAEAAIRLEGSAIQSTGDVELTKTLFYLKPRVLFTWSPNETDQVRVRVEREVGQLDFNNFVASASLNSSGVLAGDPSLVPQQDWAFEIAYDRHIWGRGIVSLAVRHLVIMDVIDHVPVFDPSGTFDEPGNIGGGAENDLISSLTLPLSQFGIPGGLVKGLATWRFSKVVDPTTGEKRPISGQHPIDAELHFSQDLPIAKFTWGLDSYIGWRERYYRFNEIDTTKQGTWNVFFIEYKPRDTFSLRFELDNAGRRPVDATRKVFPVLRNAKQPFSIDFQERNFGLGYYVRFRKSFG